MKNIFAKISKIEKLPERLKNLYTHRIIRTAGFGLLTMFGPIFLYELVGLKRTILIWLIISSLYFLLIPLVAKLFKYFSMHVFLILGTLFAAGYFWAYYLLASDLDISLWWLIGLLMVFNLLNRLFYWVPYNVNFARFVDQNHKGRRISYFWIIVSLVGIVLPVFSAWMIERFGWSALFVFGIMVILISVVPAFFIAHTREVYTFGYWQSFKKLLSRKHFKTNLAYAADGWQSGIGYFIWPIFVFMILDGNYMQVGGVMALIVLATCVLRYLTGELTDRSNKKKLIKTGSILFSLGWIFKALVSSALHIFIVGIFHDFVAVFFRTPFDALTYEIAADQGHYVDEFSALREMSLHFGRVLMFVLALIMINYVSLVWVFVLGGLVSLLFSLVNKEEFTY